MWVGHVTGNLGQARLSRVFFEFSQKLWKFFTDHDMAYSVLLVTKTATGIWGTFFVQWEVVVPLETYGWAIVKVQFLLAGIRLFENIRLQILIRVFFLLQVEFC